MKTNFTSVFSEIEGLVNDFPRIAFETGDESFKVIREPLLDTLRFYPPKLPNQRYVRTFKLRRGWKAFIQRIDSNRFAIVVSNDTDYTSFVVGTLAQTESVAASFQSAIHQGRWRLATTTVEEQFNEFLRVYDKKLSEKLSNLGIVTRRQIR